jgi:colanic acid/amylovoran biosynthesis glycosyltransferase
MSIKIALLSPKKETYSETFIQLHKKLLNGTVNYYYGGYLPLTLEGKGSLLPYFSNLYLHKILKKLFPVKLKRAKIQALKRSFIKEKIEIVFCEFGQTGAEVVGICRDLKLPLIVHFHGYDASVYKILENYKVKYLEMFKYAKNIIVVSQAMKVQLAKLGAPIDKLTVNICGPNDEFFEIKPTFKSQQFITVGRFVEKKMPHLTIEAFSYVLKRFPDATLVMCGTGGLFLNCKALISSLGIEKSVKMLGVANRDTIKALFENSIAYVQHSVTAINGDMEGTPVVILEACAAGLPVISTYHAGIPDIIINGVSGLLVEEHDVMGMASHMIKLLEDPLFAEALGKVGRSIIKNNYTIKHHMDILNDAVHTNNTFTKTVPYS